MGTTLVCQKFPGKNLCWFFKLDKNGCKFIWIVCVCEYHGALFMSSFSSWMDNIYASTYKPNYLFCIILQSKLITLGLVRFAESVMHLWIVTLGLGLLIMYIEKMKSKNENSGRVRSNLPFGSLDEKEPITPFVKGQKKVVNALLFSNKFSKTGLIEKATPLVVEFVLLL